MPRYDYECDKCGQRFEVVQSMNDPKLCKCLDETCNGEMKRLLGTGAGIIFKGSGFYQTDYRSASYEAGVKAEKSSAGESSGKTETAKTETTKTESAKPAATSTTTSSSSGSSSSAATD